MIPVRVNMSLASTHNHLAILTDRAQMLGRARQFFAERDVMEVDCPLLCHAPAIDAHIDVIPATYVGREPRYLFTSPEYGMKRLLAEGCGDIYQLSHVFRDGEHGERHQPEFCLAEWYRVGMTFEEMIAETVEFIELFVGAGQRQVMTYHEMFQQFAGVDIEAPGLLNTLREKGVELYSGVEERDELLNLLLGQVIEPQLGREGVFVVTHYPASQAALARTITRDGVEVAERFEVYYRGVELANGYHELIDAEEQRQRFIRSNEERQQLGKVVYPLDEAFLAALEKGIPDCCGVAVGFDRLMMVRHGTESLADVIPFDWSES